MNLSAAPTSTQRALAAIVLTDAAGFSARMSDDEEGTLALIQRDLKLMARLCDSYGGQVLKSTGDGLLMSFVSAVQAVSCSQEIQKELAELAEGKVPQEYLMHRIGIHLGDVLFSYSDVLGNGVNIAARLQTQSTPGGICISQTVYDVVKGRLHFDATFLGPLKLKNIKEPVPAYQIPPFGQAATVVVPSQQLGADQETSETSLATVVQILQQDSQYRRIKKLIFGTCQGVWENEASVVSQYELLPLLEKLFHRYSTLASLEGALRAMASQLNRKVEYLTVADIICQAFEPLYRGKNASAEVLAEDNPTVAILAEDNPAAPTERTTYQEIAADLTQQPEQLRIKKLLYAIIHTAWENDKAILAQHSMEDLVAAVHQMAAGEADLDHHLERIIKRLNRQSRYAQVASVISDAFYRLYKESSSTSSSPVEATALVMPNGEQTMMAVEGFPISEGGSTLLNEPEHIHSSSSEQTKGQAQSLPLQETNSEQLVKPRDRANLFGLRLEIMRYTNPLRAKILMLSTVRSPFAFTQQDWITLKTKTLDELIQEVFDYCKTYTDLESKLTIMSHCLGNFVESTQTAGAILQAMKPFYPTPASSDHPT